MKKFWMVALVALVGLATWASQPDFLFRVVRKGDADRMALVAGNMPVVADFGSCLLVRGNRADQARLREIGHEVEILDSSPWLWDYYHVGLRPDSDIGALTAVGTVLFTEDNWVLLRVVPDADLSRLYEAKVFLAKVPTEPFKEPLFPSLPEPEPARSEATLAAVPLVQQMVNSVADADIMSTWTSIVPSGSGTRYSTATGCSDAATTVYNTFTSLGLAAQKVTYQSGYAPNVVGQITGAVNPGVIYLVEGHLDDMPSSGYAPGANDNASGSVAVLQAAKALSCYAFKNTVRFLTTTGEEQGLYGSTAYANSSYSAGENIQGVLNMDMPGWEGDNSPTGEDLDLNYDSNSQSLGTFFKQCATDYTTGLAVNAFLCPSLDASDHYPFWQKGYKAVCGITDNEGYCSHNGTYPYYHTSSDTILNSGNGTTSHTFFYKVVRTTVAALAALGEPFKITTDAASYGTTGTVTLIVGDRDLNTSSTTTQTVTVQVWSTTESTPETVTLTEQGTNSMIFKGTIALAAGTAANGDGKLTVAAGDTITAKYVDAADCNGSTNVAYTATATVTGTTGYSISGTVSLSGGGGLSGATVTAGTATTTTATDGTYTIGGLASGTYSVTPSKSGYTFSPTSTSVTLAGANQTGKNFTATASSGDTPLTSGVGVAGSVAASAYKYYTIAVPSGATALTITLSGLSADVDLYANNSATHPTTSSYYGRSWNSGMTAESLSYTNPTSATWCIGVYGYAAGNFTVTATVTTGTTTYSISGTITASGTGLSSVTVTAGSKAATTATDGTYTISGLVNGTYTVTPSKTGYTFSPTSTSVTISGAIQTGKNFTGTATTTTYSIAGTITASSVGLSGVTVTAGTASATTASDGTYTISGLVNGTYTVTPSKTGYTFSPTSTSVTISGANQTGKNFTGTATTTTYSIAGTITASSVGLSGVTVTAGTASATTASDGTYTISGLVNGTYTLTPSKTGYTFSPTSTSVTISGANQTGKNFTGTASGGTTTQILLNPGFESGANGNWTISTSTSHTVMTTVSTPQAAHGGSYQAQLGYYNGTYYQSETDSIRQTVTIPSAATAATLSFWYNIRTAETTTSTAYDKLTITVENTSGTVLATLTTLSNLNKTTTWTQKTGLSLLSYKGQTVVIRFKVTTDSSLGTFFGLEDTALNVTQ